MWCLKYASTSSCPPATKRMPHTAEPCAVLFAIHRAQRQLCACFASVDAHIGNRKSTQTYVRLAARTHRPGAERLQRHALRGGIESKTRRLLASARGSLAKNRNSKRPFSAGFNQCERIQSTCVRRTLLRVGRETYCGMDRSGAPCLCFAPL